MRLALALALATVPFAAATAATSTLTAASGSWVRLFTRDVETALGRSVRVDAASVTAGGLGRSFRELDVLVKARGRYPAGTRQFSLRSVDCNTGRVRMEQWQLVSASGAVLDGSAVPGSIERVQWDKQDGLVLRYVCQGIVPR
ncbi:hypothetical protein [Novosphingobium resinovorum]|uniref:hypothetical protein n=1 Tax=Novosphingobium resinovorum TaxID=158500 RepID=UPI002ED3DC76|nr:hypothetical protein [Novosphingobium resinovorum]